MQPTSVFLLGKSHGKRNMWAKVQRVRDDLALILNNNNFPFLSFFSCCLFDSSRVYVMLILIPF